MNKGHVLSASNHSLQFDLFQVIAGGVLDLLQ